MPQISKGDTFVNGEQVTGGRLNQLVDSAVILNGVITDQGAITANTVANDDLVLLYDASANALKKASVSDLLNSNLPISIATINGLSGTDIAITPAAGQKVDIAGNLEAENVNVVGTLNGTSAIKIASGTTAQRPAVPLAGHIRFNTENNTLEVYSGTGWINGNTSGDANFTGLVNAQNFTLRNKNLMWGIYDTAVYYIANASQVTHSYGVISHAYFETTVTHTKPVDEVWGISFGFKAPWQIWGDFTPRNYTLELKTDDGTTIGAVETVTYTPYSAVDIDGYTYIPPQDVNVNFSKTIPAGISFTGKKLRVFFKWTAGVWYIPNTNGGTGIAGSAGEALVSMANRTLTIGKSAISNYP